MVSQVDARLGSPLFATSSDLEAQLGGRLNPRGTRLGGQQLEWTVGWTPGLSQWLLMLRVLCTEVAAGCLFLGEFLRAHTVGLRLQTAETAGKSPAWAFLVLAEGVEASHTGLTGCWEKKGRLRYLELHC